MSEWFRNELPPISQISSAEGELARDQAMPRQVLEGAVASLRQDIADQHVRCADQNQY